MKLRSPIPTCAVFLCIFFVGSFLHSENIRRMEQQQTLEENGPPMMRISPSFNISTGRNTTKQSLPVGDAVNWTGVCQTAKEYVPRTKVRKEFSKLGFDVLRPRDGDSCDFFSGKWVFDNSSRPLYAESSCPYMSDQLACTKHGRQDTGYQYWRWQPHGCDLKRWNATAIWEKLRGKRLMFVGDSLNRGQWISMVCMLQSVIPEGKKYMTPNAALTIFKAKEYNASVEFYWAPLLVESNSDDPVNHNPHDRIIRPDSITKHAVEWEKADILIFNSYLWWRSGARIKMLSETGRGVCEDTDGFEALKLVLQTWANWIISNINPVGTQIFFVTMSPTHLWNQEWGPKSGGNCFNETNPIEMENYWGSGSDRRIMRLLDDVLGSLGSKVSVLNITQLSEYRKDGHPTIYRKFWAALSPEQLSNPASYADCIHWCLPGVPDTWNELWHTLL